MQHALLETEAHYVDFPWRPANCIQDTGMPDRLPAANAFYDLSHPTRRTLHRAYIRHCLDELGGYSSVVFLLSQEYTGPLPFMEFWLDTIHEWEQERGRQVTVVLSATRDVVEAVLANPIQEPRVDGIDLRYWWYRADGTPFAPRGGQEVPGRYAAGFQAARESPPEQLYRQVREYRDRFASKAVLHSVEASRQQTWAFLMAGGALLIRRMEYANHQGPQPWLPPEDYQAPPDSAIIQPTYDFINAHLATRLPAMTPQDIVVGRSSTTWCLASPGEVYLVYALTGEPFELDLTAAPGDFRARWLDPRTGEVMEQPGRVRGGSAVAFQPPDGRDWALWVTRVAASVRGRQSEGLNEGAVQAKIPALPGAGNRAFTNH